MYGFSKIVPRTPATGRPRGGRVGSTDLAGFSAPCYHPPAPAGRAAPKTGSLDPMISNRRRWLRRGLFAGLTVFAGQQAWRHGHDYLFADQFAEVVPGKIYRGAWQKAWPMRRIVRAYKIRAVLALAHPPDHPLAPERAGPGARAGLPLGPHPDRRRASDEGLPRHQRQARRRRGRPGRPEELPDLLPLPPRDQPRLDGPDGLPDQVLRLDPRGSDRRDCTEFRADRGRARPRLPARPVLLHRVRPPQSPPPPRPPGP